MIDRTTIEITVGAATAHALQDERRREAIGRLVDLLVTSGSDDPLTRILEATQDAAKAAGLSQQDIADELAASNAERRG